MALIKRHLKRKSVSGNGFFIARQTKRGVFLPFIAQPVNNLSCVLKRRGENVLHFLAF